MLDLHMHQAMAFAHAAHHLIASVQEISAEAGRVPAMRPLALRLDTALAEAFPDLHRAQIPAVTTERAA
jgi:hypothetical protein